MNEEEIKWANGLYEITDGFSKLAEKIFEENKFIIGNHLTKLWKYLDEGGIINEALRYSIRSEALRNLGTVLEYNASIYADRLRDGVQSLSTKVSE